jgi:hypothetical protein
LSAPVPSRPVPGGEPVKPSAEARTFELPGLHAPKIWRVKVKGGALVHFLAAGSYLHAPALCGTDPYTMIGESEAKIAARIAAKREAPTPVWSRVVATNNTQCNACVAAASSGRMRIEEKT